ncbi:MAG: histidine phosphatase family protein [Anaerovoracaceae bacterium]
MKINLIRHGITEGNKKKWYYGSSDIPLEPEGIEEIKNFVKDGIYPKPDGQKLYTSGLLRTEQTFELIFGELEHKAEPGFREYNFGEFERMSYEELKKVPNYIKWIEDTEGNYVIKGGESLLGFNNRIQRTFANLMAKNEDAIVVCHGGVISAIMNHYFSEVGEHIFAWVPKPARGYTLEIQGGKPVAYEEI